MAKLFANSGDPDQMLHSAASDLGLHYLPIILLGYPGKNGLKDQNYSRTACIRDMKSKPFTFVANSARSIVHALLFMYYLNFG